MTKHNICPLPVRSVVLPKEPRISLHVVIKKKQNFSLSSRNSPVPSGCGAPVWLLKDRNRKRRGETPQGFGGAVSGPIDYDNNFEATIEFLTRQGAHRTQDHVSALVGGYNYAKTWCCI